MVESNISEDEEISEQEGPRNILITDLIKEIERANYQHSKYSILLDKTAAASVYFGHKATLKDFHKETIAVTLGRKQKSDAMEVLRKGLIYAMKYGDTLCIHVDKTVPDFKSMWTSDEFPTADIFNFEEFHKRVNYLKVVSEEENIDIYGNKGMYVMHKDFRLVILATW